MKKGFSLALALMILFLSACAAAPETIPEFQSDLGDEVDFDGMNFVVAQDRSNDSDNIFLYTRDSLYYDIVQERINDVETSTNCKLNFTMSLGIGSDITINMLSSIAGGIVMCDFAYFGSDNANMRAAQGGALYPLDDFSDYINLSDYEKYGTPNIRECCMANGLTYGVIPVSWPQKANDCNMTTVFIINENLINRYDLADPRDLYEQGSWLLSTFEDITPSYHISEGASDIKFFYGNSISFASGFLSAYGLRHVFEKNGVLTSMADNPITINAIEWGRDYVTTRQGDYEFVNRWDSWVDMVDGRCFLALNDTSAIRSVSENLENFGFVPFPRSESIPEESAFTYFSTYPTMSIFIGTHEPEACAILIDKLFEPFNGYETVADMEDFLYKTMFFDMRDVKLYMNIYKNGIYDYYGIGGTAYQNIQGSYLTKTGAEISASLSGTMDDMIDYIAPNYNVINEYWVK